MADQKDSKAVSTTNTAQAANVGDVDTSAKVEPKTEAKAPVKTDARPAPEQKPASATKKPAAKKARAKPARKAPARKAPARKTAAPGPATTNLKTITPQETIDELKEKIMANTKTTTTDFTKTMQDAGAEMQARMKAAYEKSTGMSGEMADLAKGNAEAFVASGKILAEGVQSIGRDAVEESRTAFETLTADMKKMAAVKSPTELFQLQGEIARRNFDAMIGYGSKNTEAMVKLANDAFAPISNRMSVAAEKISKAA